MLADATELKAAADAAFNQGRLEDALALYEELMGADPTSAAALCNHSAVALKCGRPDEALQSADRALQLLALKVAAGDEACRPLLAKAHHRKAQALLGAGAVVAAVRVYRQGLDAVARAGTCQQGIEELLAALRLTAEQLPPSWLAKYWARLVEEAQAPNPLSSRDGRLLKIVPPERRLAPEQLQAHLEAALKELQGEGRDLMCEAWAQGRQPGKAEAAFFRAAAYNQAGNHQQALKDVRVALVYGPQALAEPAAGPLALVPAKDAGGSAPPAPREVPCWPAALALQAAAQEALGDNLAAALSACKALELDPGNEGYDAMLQRLLRRIPEEHARVLQERGSAGLEACLAAEKEERLPEFLRKRPKYYYYYEWMRKRINEQYPELPEPVMDKLLTMEANELDLILQYPQATQQTVERVLGVYQEKGEEYLETYRVPLLSWEEVKALKGPDTVGLPLGDSEFGGLLGGSGQGSQAQKAPAALPQLAAAAAAALGAPLAGGPLELAAGGGEEEGGDARSDGSASVQEEVGEEEEGEEFADLYELD